MPALKVIEALQVVEKAGYSLLAGIVACALDFSLQGSEERLDNRIVLAVTLPDMTC